jgi:hypothetical protein
VQKHPGGHSPEEDNQVAEADTRAAAEADSREAVAEENLPTEVDSHRLLLGVAAGSLRRVAALLTSPLPGFCVMAGPPLRRRTGLAPRRSSRSVHCTVVASEAAAVP